MCPVANTSRGPAGSRSSVREAGTCPGAWYTGGGGTKIAWCLAAKRALRPRLTEEPEGWRFNLLENARGRRPGSARRPDNFWIPPCVVTPRANRGSVGGGFLPRQGWTDREPGEYTERVSLPPRLERAGTSPSKHGVDAETRERLSGLLLPRRALTSPRTHRTSQVTTRFTRVATLGKDKPECQHRTMRQHRPERMVSNERVPEKGNYKRRAVLKPDGIYCLYELYIPVISRVRGGSVWAGMNPAPP